MKKKEYQLSKNAIKYLEDIKIEDKSSINIKSITIMQNFIFQVEKVEKIKLGIYTSTLIDSNMKSDKFILILDKKEEIPNKGDIIEIGHITKKYNEKDKIYNYECKKIIFIKKINEKEHNDIKNNKNNDENEIDEDEEEEEDDEEDEKEDKNDKNEDKKEQYNNKIINNFEEEKIGGNNIHNYNKINNHIDETKDNKKEIYLFENKKEFQNSQNFLLVSNLNYYSSNFNIYLKCLEKFQLKEFKSNKDKHYQNYIFEDINNDKIEAVSFDEMSFKLDKIITKNEFYQINNCYVISNNEAYRKTNCPYKLILAKTIEIFNISNMEIIKNKFKNNLKEILNKNENDKNFVKISKIINKNKNELINIFGFVLKDYGNNSYYDRNNNEYYGRNLLLGDDSNYKIIITLWSPNKLEKVFNEGELLFIQNIKVIEYKRIKHLYSTKFMKIKNTISSELDEKLKKYYSEHKDINKYLEPIIINKFINNSNQNYLNLYFIKDIFKILYNKDNIDKKAFKFKISACVKKVSHSPKNYYYGCDNCKKKMVNDVCNNCGGKKKIIIIHYTVEVVDSTSILYLLFFGDIAENFLGIKAEEYKNILEKGISYKNKELNLLNIKLKDTEFVFLGNIQYYDYSYYKGYRFVVKSFYKKNKKHYYNLVSFLKNLLK